MSLSPFLSSIQDTNSNHLLDADEFVQHFIDLPAHERLAQIEKFCQASPEFSAYLDQQFHRKYSPSTFTPNLGGGAVSTQIALDGRFDKLEMLSAFNGCTYQDYDKKMSAFLRLIFQQLCRMLSNEDMGYDKSMLWTFRKAYDETCRCNDDAPFAGETQVDPQVMSNWLDRITSYMKNGFEASRVTW